MNKVACRLTDDSYVQKLSDKSIATKTFYVIQMKIFTAYLETMDVAAF